MRRLKAPVGTSRRGGLALLRRLIVFRQAPACRAIRTPEPARPRMRHSAERRALGLRLCARHAPRYYVSAPPRRNARRKCRTCYVTFESGHSMTSSERPPPILRVAAALDLFMVRPFLRRRAHTPFARRQIQRRQSGRSVVSRRRHSDRRNPPKRGWFGPSGRQVSQAAPPSLPPEIGRASCRERG